MRSNSTASQRMEASSSACEFTMPSDLSAAFVSSCGWRRRARAPLSPAKAVDACHRAAEPQSRHWQPCRLAHTTRHRPFHQRNDRGPLSASAPPVRTSASGIPAEPLSTAARVSLPALRATDFRHPLDEASTRSMDLLTRFTGLNMLVRQVIGPIAEQIIEVENISMGVLVGPEQLPRLHRLLVEACSILGLNVPDLYIRQNPVPNAYTMAIDGRRPFIVVHSSLLDMGLTDEEIQAVLAHELGHLKCEHGVWVTVANLLLLALAQLGELGQTLANTLVSRLCYWLQAAELSCDRASLLVVQDPRLVVSVIMKLSGGSVLYANEMNPEAYLKQAARLDQVSRTLIGRRVRQQIQRAATHPLPVVRARELDRWAHSPEYRRVLRKGVKLDALAGNTNGKRE
ncbi:hypothetical protein CDCA_CDCA06G1826 [Cyanidium caldarium]|uniref:Peptidase M48 domain-containing protein n=1 Tax=Cyanidium caldarium TaxID=2771 RepID=A0AAV9IUL7_CYACA|nr:hypothetical protein CDCA_CDCA06G1826 [Cyanidium caldarium]